MRRDRVKQREEEERHAREEERMKKKMFSGRMQPQPEQQRKRRKGRHQSLRPDPLPEGNKTTTFGVISRTKRQKILDYPPMGPPIGHYRPKFEAISAHQQGFVILPHVEKPRTRNISEEEMFRSCSRLKVDFANTSVSQVPSPRTQAKHKKTISSGVGIGLEEEEVQVVEDPAVLAAEEKKAALYDTDQTKKHMRSFYIEKLTPRKQIIDGFY